MTKMKKYFSLIQGSAQRAISYRSNFLINSGITCLLFFSSFYLWNCIYTGRDEIASYSWDDMKTYLFVSFISNAFLSWYAESALSKKILDGTVEMDLLKPLGFQTARLAESIGSTLFEVVIVFVLTIPMKYVFNILLPASATVWILFLCSLVLSILCKFAIIYIFSMFCFCTTSYIGVSWARQAITNLLSGAVIPLTFLPDKIQDILKIMPFQYVVDIPANILLNTYEVDHSVNLLIIGIGWTILLFILGKALYSLLIQKLTINGG